MGAADEHRSDPMEYLYPPSLLTKLNFARSPTKFNPPISAVNPGEPWMVVRPLQRGDYDKKFITLLSQLTSVGNCSRKQFEDRFTHMKNAGGYFVTVIEDTRSREIIGSATLVVEQKFIHDCGLLDSRAYGWRPNPYLISLDNLEDNQLNSGLGVELDASLLEIAYCPPGGKDPTWRGGLEDVVVNETYRGKQLGKLIVVTVSLLSEALGCYKMSLNCKDSLIPYYKTLGYVLEPGNSNSMNMRFPSD